MQTNGAVEITFYLSLRKVVRVWADQVGGRGVEDPMY